MTTPPTPYTTTPAAPLEASNPAGPPEGVEVAAAPPEGHGSTPHADTHPLAQERHQHLDTATPDAPEVPTGPGAPGSPQAAHDRLRAHLDAHHPGAQMPGEWPADTAVRLLVLLGAKSPTGPRCPQSYCNLPQGHPAPCGWVNVT